jgi:hypothetical protein
MSRTFIVLLVITLGFPVLAFVAAALAAGANPDLISAGVTFLVVLVSGTTTFATSSQCSPIQARA